MPVGCAEPRRIMLMPDVAPDLIITCYPLFRGHEIKVSQWFDPDLFPRRACAREVFRQPAQRTPARHSRFGAACGARTTASRLRTGGTPNAGRSHYPAANRLDRGNGDEGK